MAKVLRKGATSMRAAGQGRFVVHGAAGAIDAAPPTCNQQRGSGQRVLSAHVNHVEPVRCTLYVCTPEMQSTYWLFILVFRLLSMFLLNLAYSLYIYVYCMHFYGNHFRTYAYCTAILIFEHCILPILCGKSRQGLYAQRILSRYGLQY